MRARTVTVPRNQGHVRSLGAFVLFYGTPARPQFPVDKVLTDLFPATKFFSSSADLQTAFAYGCTLLGREPQPRDWVTIFNVVAKSVRNGNYAIQLPQCLTQLPPRFVLP